MHKLKRVAVGRKFCSFSQGSKRIGFGASWLFVFVLLVFATGCSGAPGVAPSTSTGGASSPPRYSFDNCIEASNLETEKKVAINEPGGLAGEYCRVRGEVKLPTNVYVSRNKGTDKDGKFIAEIGTTTSGEKFYKAICHAGFPEYTSSMAEMVLIKTDGEPFTGPSDGETGRAASDAGIRYMSYLSGDSDQSNIFDIYVKDCEIPNRLRCESTAKTTAGRALAAGDAPPLDFDYDGKRYMKAPSAPTIHKVDLADSSERGTPKEIVLDGVRYEIFKKLSPTIDGEIAAIRVRDEEAGKAPADYIYLVREGVVSDDSEKIKAWLYGSIRPIGAADSPELDANKIWVGAWEPAETPYSVSGWFTIWIPESKPAIYLYPTEKQAVSVKVFPRNGWLTVSAPRYNNGWNVEATPDGFIYANGRTYPHLFYEAMLPEPQMSTGFDVLDGTNLFQEIRSLGKKLALTNREAIEMAEYWAYKLPEKNYYQVGLMVGEEVERIERIQVEPEPERSLRFRLIFKGLDEITEAPNPLSALSFNRSGYHLVEWGGFILE